jgi:hypothetical protein
MNINEIKKALDYNPQSGVFTWKGYYGNKKAGDVAGNIDPSGYIRIRFNGKNYRSHLLAYLLMTGKFPKHQIDHINHKRDDNRWLNLREVTRHENQKNMSLFKTNTSGHVGVSWVKAGNKWMAHICHSGKRMNLGCFDDMDTAILIRKAAEFWYGFHENHGKNRGFD